MTLRDDLIKTKALIDTPEKWCKLQMHDLSNDRHCVVGAFVDAIGFDSDAMRYLETFVPQTRSNQARPLAFFNDLKSTRHTDIMALFDHAIASSSAYEDHHK